ncbi:hypothetical protein SESBI_49487 [Sesbania bispinosa]|nr:hypothetical protein SESBI_49487 [Sesbania bispinosa]
MILNKKAMQDVHGNHKGMTGATSTKGAIVPSAVLAVGVNPHLMQNCHPLLAILNHMLRELKFPFIADDNDNAHKVEQQSNKFVVEYKCSRTLAKACLELNLHQPMYMTCPTFDQDGKEYHVFRASEFITTTVLWTWRTSCVA